MYFSKSKYNFNQRLLISSLFLFPIFFWDIEIFEFRHLILLLFLPIIYQKKVNKKDTLIFFICFLIFIHSIFYVDLNIEENLYKLLISFYLLIIIKIVNEYYRYFLEHLEFNIKFFFIIFIFFSTLISLYFLLNKGVLSPHCILGCFSTYQILYSENSHLGMIAGSLIIFQLYLMSFKQSKINFIVFFLFLIICFLNNSLTLYLSLILNSLFFLIFFQKKINIKFNIYLIIFIIICSFGIINKKAQIDKIQSIFDPVARYIQNKSYTFSSKYNILIKGALIDKANKLEQDEISKNLSSDVWIKSAKITFYSFKNYPLGVGINNFIFSHNNYIDNISVNFDITRDLNKEDASFLLAKIISEFGLFSFLIFFIIFKFIFSKKIGFQFKLFLLPNIFTQLFIRGAGYFNGGFIIFILIILFLLINKKEEND